MTLTSSVSTFQLSKQVVDVEQDLSHVRNWHLRDRLWPINCFYRTTIKLCHSIKNRVPKLEKYAKIFLHRENPLSSILELVLYLSIGYLLAAKVIRAALRKLSLKQHARDRCTEAALLGVSSAICLFLCWTELRPRRGVYRRENNLASVFTQNRLFDEHSGTSTNNRHVFITVSALLLHSAGVLWYTHGTNLTVVKKTCFFVFYIMAHNLRFKSLGPAATMAVSFTEVLLQLTRVICCFERKTSGKAALTTLSFIVYLTGWSVVFVWFVPWSLVHLFMYRDMTAMKMPSLCSLCGSLFLFEIFEVATMPLLLILVDLMLPTRRLVVGGRLECILIPPPLGILNELRELQARKLQAKAAQEEFDIRHGSNKKTRDAYKSLRMIMVVKRRLRKFREAKKLSVFPSLPDVCLEPSDELGMESEVNFRDLQSSNDCQVGLVCVANPSNADVSSISDIAVSGCNDELQVTSATNSSDTHLHLRPPDALQATCASNSNDADDPSTPDHNQRV